MLNDLKRAVCKANKDIHEKSREQFTIGNVSAFDMSTGLFVINPRDVPYDSLQPEQMIVMSLDGQKVEGRLDPSADADIHRGIYMQWPLNIGALVHMNSLYVTAFAQAERELPVLGVSQADVFKGDIKLTRGMTPEEIADNYELNIGKVITEAVSNPDESNAVLVRRHSAFVWGKNCAEAVYYGMSLEECAKLSFASLQLNPSIQPIDPHLLKKFIERK